MSTDDSSATLANLHDVIDLHPSAGDMLAECLEALRDQPQRRLPTKYLYDARGSVIFDRITELDEYYPTRTERAILDANAESIAEAIGERAAIIEPGSGDGSKAAKLLETLEKPAAVVPVEISRSHLEMSAEMLAERFPRVDVVPVCADFTEDFAAEIAGHDAVLDESPRTVFFPGSTMGNFRESLRRTVLSNFRSLAGEGGKMVLGVDLLKPEDVLHAAYNDSEGVTAEFNRNLLTRLRDELGATLDPEGWRHAAPFNREHGRIEMHLVAEGEQVIELGGERFAFEPGESIWTESSHKFTPEAFAAEVESVGFRHERTWTDARGWLAVMLFSAA